MQIIFKTAIDKFKNKFPTDFKVIPRVGEFVMVREEFHCNHSGVNPIKYLPFDKLQVVSVTHLNKDQVEVELHLSELQAKQNIQYDLNVFN